MTEHKVSDAGDQRQTIRPVDRLEAVPAAIQQRIDQLLDETNDVHLRFADIARRYRNLIGALGALGDGVDDRPFFLEQVTGLDRVHNLMLDSAYTAERSTGCIAQSLEQRARFVDETGDQTAEPSSGHTRTDTTGRRCDGGCDYTDAGNHDAMLGMLDDPALLRSMLSDLACWAPVDETRILQVTLGDLETFVAQHNWSDPVAAYQLAVACQDIISSVRLAARV